MFDGPFASFRKPHSPFPDLKGELCYHATTAAELGAGKAARFAQLARHIPFVNEDRALGGAIAKLSEQILALEPSPAALGGRP